MARPIELSEAEILDVLEKAGSDLKADPPGQLIVVSELAARSGRSGRTIRDQMKKLLQEGRAEVVAVQRRRCDGKPTTVPAYRILAKKARR